MQKETYAGYHKYIVLYLAKEHSHMSHKHLLPVIFVVIFVK